MTLPVVRVCGRVAYDGTDYAGFQVQRGVATIQGTLEAALTRFCEPVGRVAGAGRTDSGVHARGQVVAVDVMWRHDVAQLQNAWNAHLPRSITVRDVRVAPPMFHPRFSALARTYRYYVIEGDGATLGRSPLTDRFALLVTQPLDVAAMQAATQLVVGEHDFATFGQPTQGDSTVRKVLEAEWAVVTESLARLDDAPQRRLVLTISANGFLRNMVRRLVGTFLAVGRGEWSVADVEAALAARDRRCSAPLAAPNGLIFEQVQYPDHIDPWQISRGHGARGD